MKNKNSGIIGIIITIIILIFLVVISNIKIGKWSYFENAIGVVVMPIQNGLTYFKNKISGNEQFFIDVNNVKQENEYLKNKNENLEKSLRELELLKAENETLKKYVELTDKYSEYTTCPGYIIQKDISNYSKVIIINIGKNDGVEEGMTVIAEGGLVGQVISVTSNTSKVQTIIDSATMISSVISTTRDSILVRGMLDSDKNLKATYIPPEATILEGDNVETSGIGGVFPRGINIGTIKQVVNTKNITDRYAIIETGVNFEKLETVLVIIR